MAILGDHTTEPEQSVDWEIPEQAGVGAELWLIPDADHRQIKSIGQSLEAAGDGMRAISRDGKRQKLIPFKTCLMLLQRQKPWPGKSPDRAYP